MDLREKPGIIQRCGEAVLRFRLVAIFVLALVAGFFFAGWQELITMILSVSESLGIRFAEGNYLALWPWAVLAFLLLLPRFLLAGRRSGFASLGVFVCFPLLIFAVQASDKMVLPFVISFASLSVLLMVVVKRAWACALFPMLLGMTSLVGSVLGMSFAKFSTLEIGAFALLLGADIFSISLLAGKELSLGLPKAGALLAGFKKQMLPAFLSFLFVGGFFLVMERDFSSMTILKHSALALGSFLVTFVLGFSLFSFTPLSRLRAEKRSIRVPASSGTKEKK